MTNSETKNFSLKLSSSNGKEEYPKLRFCQYKNRWNIGSLNELCKINPSNTKIPEVFYYIDLECVNNGEITKELDVLNKTNAPSRAQRLLSEGDILYQTVRPYQKNNYIFNRENDLPTVASTGYAQIRCSDSIPQFIYQLLHTNKFVDKVMQRTTGTGYPAINSNDLAEIDLYYPEIQEQEKIAKFLSLVDQRIEKQRQLVESLKKYKRGLLNAIFEQKIRFSNTKWNDYKFTELGSFYNGLSGKNKDDFGLGDNEFVTYMNVYKNTIADVRMCEKVNIKDNEKQNIVEFGDILFTQSSETLEEVGFSSAWLTDKKVYLNSFCFGFRLFNKNKFYPQFLAYYLRTDFIRKLIMREGQGVTRVNLSSERLKNISLKIPPIEEQIKIASFIFKYDSKIKIAENTLEKLELTKKSLLQHMFI